MCSAAAGEADLIGREPIQAGVRSDGVLELQIFPDGIPRSLDRLVSVQADLFVSDRLPDSLHEDIDRQTHRVLQIRPAPPLVLGWVRLEKTAQGMPAEREC